MDLQTLKRLFRDAGCRRLYAKTLADNDNSKNQVYFGPGFDALNLFPNEGIFPDSSQKNPIFKAKLRFGWLLPNAQTSDAPHAQLILYPQYPEVRFSGFLRGSKDAPNALMTKRLAGRVLFLGISADRRVIGHVVAPNSAIASEFRAVAQTPPTGVFVQVLVAGLPTDIDHRQELLTELGRIHRADWIDSKQLSENGTIKPCNAQQCGGFTLEAELGIPKNSKAEPDFLGWEVKQHGVDDFAKIETGRITLITPEPKGGFYGLKGVAAFVHRFGYADKKGRKNRKNFGGVHRIGVKHGGTGMTLRLQGFDLDHGRISDPAGCIALLTDSDEVAAAWPFSSLLDHWTRKHARAVYVPSQCRTDPKRQYRYGDQVRLAVGTDFHRFLRAMAGGAVYYDPGLKLENLSGQPKPKARNQFRINSRDIPRLYDQVCATLVR